jgi:hypothetical protein
MVSNHHGLTSDPKSHSCRARLRLREFLENCLSPFPKRAIFGGTMRLEVVRSCGSAYALNDLARFWDADIAASHVEIRLGRGLAFPESRHAIIGMP